MKRRLDKDTLALLQEFEKLQEKFLEADRLFKQKPDNLLLKKRRQELLDAMRRIRD